MLTGDPEAGRAYFNGAGRCSSCHSPTGDLAGLRARTSDALTLQQRFLFPTLARSTEPGRGHRDAARRARRYPERWSASTTSTSRSATPPGDYRAFSRVPGVKVDVRDPLAAHHELLDQYTDDAIHDVVAYLWTLK